MTQRYAWSLCLRQFFSVFLSYLRKSRNTPINICPISKKQHQTTKPVFEINKTALKLWLRKSQAAESTGGGRVWQCETGGGSCGRREGHLVKAGDSTPSESLTVYSGSAKVPKGHSRLVLHGNIFLSITHQSRKWEREAKSVFILFSKSAAQSIFLEPPALVIPSWTVTSHFAHVKCMKCMVWAAVWNGCYMWWIIPHLEDVAFGKWRLSWSQELCAPSFAAGAEWWGGNLLAVKIGRVY